MIGFLQNTSSISLAKKANFHITKTSHLIPSKLVSRLEDRKKIEMYQLFESDVPFSKTYKSIWLCLFRLSKLLSRLCCLWRYYLPWRIWRESYLYFKIKRNNYWKSVQADRREPHFPLRGIRLLKHDALEGYNPYVR